MFMKYKMRKHDLPQTVKQREIEVASDWMLMLLGLLPYMDAKRFFGVCFLQIEVNYLFR